MSCKVSVRNKAVTVHFSMKLTRAAVRGLLVLSR